MKTIRSLRQAQGWTQFELALKVGVQPQTVYLWESGRRMPQAPQLRRLGTVFGICSDEIVLEASRDVNAENSMRLDDHRPRADRHPGETAPGRDYGGRPTVRGRDERDAAR